jgi:hypothetical protein
MTISLETCSAIGPTHSSNCYACQLFLSLVPQSTDLDFESKNPVGNVTRGKGLPRSQDAWVGNMRNLLGRTFNRNRCQIIGT